MFPCSLYTQMFFDSMHVNVLLLFILCVCMIAFLSFYSDSVDKPRMIPRSPSLNDGTDLTEVATSALQLTTIKLIRSNYTSFFEVYVCEIHLYSDLYDIVCTLV